MMMLRCELQFREAVHAVIRVAGAEGPVLGHLAKPRMDV